jgi:hypothetical protein
MQEDKEVAAANIGKADLKNRRYESVSKPHQD